MLSRRRISKCERRIPRSASTTPDPLLLPLRSLHPSLSAASPAASKKFNRSALPFGPHCFGIESEAGREGLSRALSLAHEHAKRRERERGLLPGRPGPFLPSSLPRLARRQGGASASVSFGLTLGSSSRASAGMEEVDDDARRQTNGEGKKRIAPRNRTRFDLWSGFLVTARPRATCQRPKALS